MARPVRRLRAHPAFRQAPPHPSLDYRPPAALRWARRATFLFIAASIFSIAYVIWWVSLAFWLQGAAEDWTQDRRADGWQMTHAPLKLDGFPFQIRLNVPTPDVSAPGVRWTATTLALSARPYPFAPVTAEIAGEQHLELSTDGDAWVFQGTVGRLALTVSDLAQPLAGLSLSARGVALDDGQGRALAVEALSLTASLLSTPPTDTDSPTGYARLNLQGMRMPDKGPLGERLENLMVAVRLMGDLTSNTLNIEGLTRWRDEGGTLEVDRLQTRYGPLDMMASGTLALDGALQPVGAATAKVKGFFETIDRLRETGLVKPDKAVAAKLVLGALSTRAANGGSELNLPVSLQDQTLFLGPIPIASLPAFSWGESGRTDGTPPALSEKPS